MSRLNTEVKTVSLIMSIVFIMSLIPTVLSSSASSIGKISRITCYDLASGISSTIYPGGTDLGGGLYFYCINHTLGASENCKIEITMTNIGIAGTIWVDVTEGVSVETGIMLFSKDVNLTTGQSYTDSVKFIFDVPINYVQPFYVRCGHSKLHSDATSDMQFTFGITAKVNSTQEPENSNNNSNNGGNSGKSVNPFSLFGGLFGNTTINVFGFFIDWTLLLIVLILIVIIVVLVYKVTHKKHKHS